MERKTWIKWTCGIVGLVAVAGGAFVLGRHQAPDRRISPAQGAELAEVLLKEGIRRREGRQTANALVTLREAYRWNLETHGRFDPKTYTALEALTDETLQSGEREDGKVNNALPLLFELRVVTTNVLSGEEATEKLVDIELDLASAYQRLGWRREQEEAEKRSLRLSGKSDAEVEEEYAERKELEAVAAKTARALAQSAERLEAEMQIASDKLIKEQLDAFSGGGFLEAVDQMERAQRLTKLESADDSWCEGEWKRLNDSFDAAAGASYGVYHSEMARRTVLTLKAEQNARLMALVALNLKKLPHYREMRLQRALALSQNPEIIAWRKELTQSQTRNVQFVQGLSKPVPGKEGLQEWMATMRAAGKTLSNERNIRLLALAVPGAGRRGMLAPETVHASLPSKSVLVEMLSYTRAARQASGDEDRYGAVVFAPGQPLHWVELGTTREVHPLIARYWDILNSRNPPDAETLKDYDAELETVLSLLYKKIWRGIEQQFPSGTTTVYVSPDGQLDGLAFATLAKGKRLLGQDYEFRQLVSGRDLMETNLPLTRTRVVQAFTDPDVSQGDAGWRVGSESLGRLPQARAEEKALAELAHRHGKLAFRSASGSNVTEAAVAQVESPLMLHLGMHGFYKPLQRDASNRGSTLASFVGTDSLAPLYRGGLALTGANRDIAAWPADEFPTPKTDGVLLPIEAAALNLQGTWLVTLAACHTGVGGAAAGGGDLSLKLGFLQAGAHNVLFTLWGVDSGYAPVFFRRFYEEAFRTGDPSTALFQVQRTELGRLSFGTDATSLWRRVRFAGPFAVVTRGQRMLPTDLTQR